MAFDWKKLEREENERQNRIARSMGLGWMVIGVLGPAVRFLIAGSFDWIYAVIWIAVGLIMFVPAIVVLRRRSKDR